MRIAFQNLQCVGKSSPETKHRNIVKDLRNFNVWYPDYYFFVECGISMDDESFKEFGAALFKSTGSRLSSDWGFEFDFCDPHKSGLHNHKATEAFAVFRALSGSGVQRRKQMIEYREASFEQEAGILGARQRSYGTRQLGVTSLLNPSTGRTLDVLLCHPSPTNKVDAVLTLLQHAHENYVKEKRPFILLGDLNVSPSDALPTRGKETLKTAQEWAENNPVAPGLLDYIRCCGKRAGPSEVFNMIELARFYEMAVKSPGADTHADGELDYMIHSQGLAVKGPWILPKTEGGSDHNAIYFDVDF